MWVTITFRQHRHLFWGILGLWPPASCHVHGHMHLPFMSRFLAGSTQDTVAPHILKNIVAGQCLVLGLAAGVGDRRSGGLHPLDHHSGISKTPLLEDSSSPCLPLCRSSKPLHSLGLIIRQAFHWGQQLNRRDQRRISHSSTSVICLRSGNRQVPMLMGAKDKL